VSIDEDTSVDLVNTHLSIHLLERMMQVRALISDTDPEAATEKNFAPVRPPTEMLVLCGDLNAGSWSPVYRWFLQHLHDAQRGERRRALATWPSRFPLLRLDHVWLGSRLKSERVIVPRTPLTQKASDHLPLIVDVRVDHEFATSEATTESAP
jgi:endonuclease/exonuclease/phosphatase family metal-dependent hydrolase